MGTMLAACHASSTAGVAALTGRPPAKAIERELGVASRTAAHWIRLARNAGRLEGLGYAAGRPPRG